MTIKKHEIEIQGVWKIVDGRVEADENCKRIDELIHAHLRKLGQDKSGWELLYVDPDDGRLWELTYPEGEMHGGGPPKLRWISEPEAKDKYTEAFYSWKKQRRD